MSEVAKIIEDHVAKARLARTHPAKLMVLINLLKQLFGVEIEELIPGIEAKIGSKMWGLRGSADLLFSNVVFELKVDLGKELDDAKQKLIKYLQVLHEREPERKSIGIATDVLEFKAYAPILESGQVIDLKEIGSINLASATPSDSVLWLDSFIFSQPKVRPTAQDLKWRFGPGSPTYSIATDDLRLLWKEVEAEREVALKLDLWARNMEIVYGSKPELDSFIDHTYLVTLVKLIVYLRLSGDNEVREDRIKRVLTGEYFSSYGIKNLIEEDFFTWILHPRVANRTLKLVSELAKELLRYEFSQIDEDFFKEIYQEIVGKGERHRIGEYYTPEWLAQLVLNESINLWFEQNRGFPRILDPACGSGTFLCNAIRVAREQLQTKGERPDQILDFIIGSIVGVDINPLAAIIARANYLIALGELVQLGKPIIIPIYVADSIRIPKVLTRLITDGSIDVYQIEVDNRYIQIPKTVAIQKVVLSKVLEAFKDAANTYRSRPNRNEALEIFRREASRWLTAAEFEVLSSALTTILELMDDRLNSIWIFMLSNIYAPIALMESKFDIVVGNPPWNAMRYIENKSYQDFLKQHVFEYNLLDRAQVHLFTQMEIATLFYVRSCDLYLKDGGIIAFVMPRSVLTGAFHHANFKLFKKPKMRLAKIYDLEDVSPLFNVPSCVLIAVKGGETNYPVLARKYSGRLPEKNLGLAEATKHLIASDYAYEPPKALTKSYYYDHIRAGAAIYPRCFYFIEFDVHPSLGIDATKPMVKTSEEVMSDAKEPWKNIRLSGNVESDFIYATLLGRDLVPFGYVKLRPIVLPVEVTSGGYRLLDVDDLMRRGYVHVGNWFEKVQELWEKKRTKKAEKTFPRVIDGINYQGLLTIQNPHIRYVVIYNSSGTNLVACVIDKKKLSSFPVGKMELSPKGFIAEKTTQFYETNDEQEAHFLCAVLNSKIVNEAIKPLQPRGLWGERHIMRRPFLCPIPKFDKNDQLQLKLAELSKRCHTKIASLKFIKESTAGRRREARKAIKQEVAEIDKLVSQLLGVELS